MTDDERTAEQHGPHDSISAEVEEAEVVDGRGEFVRTIPIEQPPSLAVAPRVTAGDLVKRLELIREASDQAMQRDVDYGVIPGTGTKPTLLKPGAEKLSVLFELDIQLVNEKRWDPPHLTVVSRAIVYHAPSGTRIGYGEGICTTHERKYAKRTANLRCPDCNVEAILKSKHEPEFFCWKKRGGCGNTYLLDDPRITSQEQGEVENPDLPDTWNTVVKMAEKRARIDAVLAVTGASALFTQDMEDAAAQASPEAASGESVTPTGEDTGKPSPAQRGLITRLVNERVPEEHRTAVKALATSSAHAGRLIGRLKAGELAPLYRAAGITPPSDVPVDMSDFEPDEAAEVAKAQGDPVTESLFGIEREDG